MKKTGIANRDMVRSYIQNTVFASGPSIGGKILTGKRIGIEMENFVFERDLKSKLGFKTVSLHKDKGAFGELLASKTNPTDIIRKSALNTLGHPENEIVDTLVYADGDQIRFEPGGQLEIITPICGTMREAENILTSKQRMLTEQCKGCGYHFLQYGTNPWFTAEEIDLQLHFPRYRSMKKYFDSIGPYGRQMMLQTCSMHLNFDFGGSETQKIKRYVAANLLVPFATLMFSNSSVIGSKKVNFTSYRGFIWQNLDPKRTGMAHLNKLIKSWHIDDLIDDYTEFALNAPVIFINDNPHLRIAADFTLNDWIKKGIQSVSPTENDLFNHLSMLFPYVRPKGYLEIRTTDAPPEEWQMIPAMFYYGILYSDHILDRVLELLIPEMKQLENLLKQAVLGYGNHKIDSICTQLMNLSMEACHELGTEYIQINESQHLAQFAEQFVFKRRTFSDLSDNLALDNFF